MSKQSLQPIQSPQHLAVYHHNAKGILNEVQRSPPLPATDPKFAAALRSRDSQAIGVMGMLLTQIGNFLTSARCTACGIPISIDGFCYNCNSSQAVQMLKEALVQIRDQEHTAPTPKEMAMHALGKLEAMGAIRKEMVNNAFKVALGGVPGGRQAPNNGNDPVGDPGRIVKPS